MQVDVEPSHAAANDSVCRQAVRTNSNCDIVSSVHSIEVESDGGKSVVSDHPAKPSQSPQSSSHENLESSVSSDGSLTCVQGSRSSRYINDDLNVRKWDDCEPILVNQLPYDIDGLCRYVIFCPKEDMMRSSKDGRPWKTWVQSSRKGFFGIRRVARCKGSPTCNVADCPFLRNGSGPNRTQFKRLDGTVVCYTCGSPATPVLCNTSKVLEYDKSQQCLTVMHMGIHTCRAKQPKCIRDLLKQVVLQNPRVKAGKLVDDQMVKMMTNEQFDWNEIESIARAFSDVKRVHNVRADIQNQQNPVGQNFEALGLFKSKCDERDRFLVYRINSRQLNGQPSYVFKSSTEMARLAQSMDRDGNGQMKDEYAHVDATHKRCRGFKTVTLWAYHEISRKLVCLAIMDIENENTENLTIFWTLMNEMLQELSGNSEYTFNPKGFVADEHHANWRSIHDVFGSAGTDRTVSCEFHSSKALHVRHDDCHLIQWNSQECAIFCWNLKVLQNLITSVPTWKSY